MEMAIDTRVRRIFHEHNPKLFQNQSGWQRGRGIDEQILRVMCAAKEAENRQQHFGMMSIDIKNCFDTLKHGKLQKKLIAAGLKKNGMYEQWMMHSLSTRHCATRVGQHTTKFKPHKWGVPQGSVLSPIVAAVYLNDLDTNQKMNLEMWP